jgi:calcineurin-like phosphoesterase family protein
MTDTNPLFISDTHWFHQNIIKYCNRPFESADEMNETLLTNWNAKVKPQDTVYFLGDFAFAPHDKVKAVLDRLNGNIHLCRGNHDKPLNSLHHYFTSVFDLKTIMIKDETCINGVQPIVLCHYPLLTWDRQRYNSWMLHGHVHSPINTKSSVKRYDVGVDANNYTPISYLELKEWFNTDK